jgi:hypothetical protein
MIALESPTATQNVGLRAPTTLLLAAIVSAIVAIVIPFALIASTVILVWSIVVLLRVKPRNGTSTGILVSAIVLSGASIVIAMLAGFAIVNSVTS